MNEEDEDKKKKKKNFEKKKRVLESVSTRKREKIPKLIPLFLLLQMPQSFERFHYRPIDIP